jgi:hypothetical protein
MHFELHFRLLQVHKNGVAERHRFYALDKTMKLSYTVFMHWIKTVSLSEKMILLYV